MFRAPLSPAGHRYNLRPDGVDLRDQHAPKMKVMLLPAQANLKSNLGPVKNQRDLGCCTGFANAGLREHLYRAQYPWEKDKTVPADQLVLSPLFLYFAERAMEGTIAEDAGASMRSGMVVLNRLGTCLESDDPYDTKRFKDVPTEAMIASAQHYRGGAYHLLDDLQQMRECLASGYVFTMGIAVYDSFESHDVALTGNVPLPDPKREQLLGGHAILVYGYDDAERRLLVRNSWGKDWGSSGNFTLPYQFVNAGFGYDAWIAHLGPAWK